MARFLAFSLSTTNNTSGLNLAGAMTYCQWEQAKVGYAFQDQANLVDLNTGSPQLVQKLFLGLGLRPADAQRLSDDLTDFKDTNRDAAEGGSEPDLYSGRQFGPKNAPFETPYKLDQLPEMNAKLLDELVHLTTVYSHATGYDETRAPAALKLALGTDNKEQAFSSPSPSKTVALDVVVETKEKARFYRRTSFSMTSQPARPFAVLSWEQGADAKDWLFPAGDLPDCL